MNSREHVPADTLRQLAGRQAEEAMRVLGGDDEAGVCCHALRRALAGAYTDHLRRVVETTAWR